MRTIAALLGFVLMPRVAAAADETLCVSSDASICLPRADFQRFLDIALERQCLDRDQPQFHVDPITIITDTEGRVFYKGADPDKPYKVTMKWCHYDVEADGKVAVVAAMQTPAESGVRLRPKAYLGYLPMKLSKGKFNDGVDAGFLIDWLFIHEFNLNVAAGFRSLGIGVGVDLTRNFGIYAGYAVGYTGPMHNINASIYFAF